MVIVAFMQNMWVRDVARVERLIATYGEPYRRRLIAMALFSGCLSGRRLQAAFGADLCRQIQWDEASPVVAGESSAAPPADPHHMRHVINHYKPDLVLCFGRSAAGAIRDVWSGKLVCCPHPAARQDSTVGRLAMCAEEVNQIIRAPA